MTEEKLSDKEIIRKIAKIITTDGENMTDGECVDAIWILLAENRKLNR